MPAPMSLPFDATLTALLQSGDLGDLREVAVTCTNAVSANADAPFTWRQDLALSGKNTMFLGIYYEMVLRWLQVEPVSVVADAAVFTKERRDSDGVPAPVVIPESLTVLGTYPAGARLVMHCSGVEPGRPRNEIRLNGSKAGVRLDLAQNELWLARIGAAEELVAIPEGRRGAWRVEADFVDSIREKRPVRLTDFATGLRYMRFTDAVWQSWNQGGARVVLV